MKALVTGAAGFIGSTLGEYLLAEGSPVRGVDCFTPYYDVKHKEANLERLLAHPNFEFVEADLRVRDASGLLHGIDVVYHLAAQPGVRLSWSDSFAVYNEHNILATQRLLEGAKAGGVDRFVYASSSSVYGNAEAYPTTETDLPRPHSPYGVTKLGGEHLCGLYAANWGVPTVSLRYFTVYGPRQRPDMAMHRLIEAALAGTVFPLYGTGEQIRDFTFVGDVVRATAMAGWAEVPPATVLNVAGGSSVSMNETVRLVEEAVGREVQVVRHMGQPGDVQRTGGSVERIADLLSWKPETSVRNGIAAQVQWHLDQRR